MDYWNECVSEAFEDQGITATDKQVDGVASWIESAHENYGMAFGHDALPNPQAMEVDRLKRELQREKDKTICKKCKGSGEEVSHGPIHSCYSSCYKCNGGGYIYR